MYVILEQKFFLPPYFNAKYKPYKQHNTSDSDTYDEVMAKKKKLPACK